MKKKVKLNNDVKIPRIGLGVYKIDEKHMESAVKAAEDSGYRAFDTAYFYFNEKELGEAIKKVKSPVKISLLRLSYGMIIKVMTAQKLTLKNH